MVNIKFSFNANDINDVEIVKNAVDSIYSKIKSEKVNTEDTDTVVNENSTEEESSVIDGNEINEIQQNSSSCPNEEAIVTQTEPHVEYYKTNAGNLIETKIDSTALFVLKEIDNENFEFRINETYSSPKDACEYRERDLLPFCEILEESKDSNTIEMNMPGKATKIGSDVKIEEKIKIKLIRR